MCKLYVPRTLTELIEFYPKENIQEKPDLLPLYNPKTDKPYMIDSANVLIETKMENYKSESSSDSDSEKLKSRNLCLWCW